MKTSQADVRSVVQAVAEGVWCDPDPMMDLAFARRHALWRVQCLMEWVKAVDNVMAGRAPRAGRPAVRGCTDCETMTHCETHQKEEDTYPQAASSGSSSGGYTGG